MYGPKAKNTSTSKNKAEQNKNKHKNYTNVKGDGNIIIQGVTGSEINIGGKISG